MESALSASSSALSSSRLYRVWQSLWPSERIAAGFFVFLALLAARRHNPPTHVGVLLLIAASICAAGTTQTRLLNGSTRALREWLSLGLILLAYWSIEWFSTPLRLDSLQTLWLSWDRTLLDGYGLRQAIEAFGATGPWLLETAYLLLYTMPVVALIVLQLRGTHNDRTHFLFTLFLGTFSVYAILPLVSVESPRRVFPLQDEPRIVTLPRQINTYVLDHMDISTGVFPSGHVAVAFSTAFGLLGFARSRNLSLALPAAAFALGTLIYLATIYGRYHYAVDGLASIAIATAAWFSIRNWSVSHEI